MDFNKEELKVARHALARYKQVLIDLEDDDLQPDEVRKEAAIVREILQQAGEHLTKLIPQIRD